MTSEELIRKERQRQIAKGYDAAHNDTREEGELTDAAEAILHAYGNPHHPLRGEEWHIHIIKKWRGKPVRMLIIAAALLTAEIERLQRKEQS